MLKKNILLQQFNQKKQIIIKNCLLLAQDETDYDTKIIDIENKMASTTGLVKKLVTTQK